METLHLVLKGKWFDMIESGEKTEEYRAFTPYWCNRLINTYGMYYWEGMFSHNSIESLTYKWSDGYPYIFGINGIRRYDAICFHRGYTNTIATFKNDGLNIGIGNIEWGAPKDKEVFIIKIGEKINISEYADVEDFLKLNIE